MKYRLKVKKCSFGLLSAGKLKTQRQNEQGHGKSQEYKEDEYAYLINSCVSLLFTRVLRCAQCVLRSRKFYEFPFRKICEISQTSKRIAIN